MTVDEFARFVAREHEHLELKTGAGRRPIQETMVAFTNVDGGAILVGVKDDRTVLGRRRDQGLDDDIHGAANDAHSVGRYEITEISVGGKPVVAILVNCRNDAAAQTSDGRVLVRQGGHNRALFGRELLELLAARSLVRFESTDSGVERNLVSQTESTAVARAFGWTEPSPARWRERGLLHESGRLTVAGALVLTDPAASLSTAKFQVDVRVYEDDRGGSYVYRESVGGPVQAQVDRASALILERIGTEMVITGTRRHDVPRLPPRVVREAIANAVAHRSYEFDEAPVVVDVRPSGVLVTSPGLLPAPVTIDTLRQAQAPRNHTVIDVLRRFGLAEDSGQGIDVIQDSMRLDMLNEPIFSETTDSFSVELPLRGLISTTERAWLLEHERTGLLQPEDRNLLVVMLRDGRVTNARARDVLRVDSTRARARLHRLRDAGLLTQHGTRGRAYYTVGSLGPHRSDQQTVLDAAARAAITNEQVRLLTGLDRVAARALLRRLVDEGYLLQHGSRRGTRYTRP
jgi:ATP-dependent DNA helicase RecG